MHRECEAGLGKDRVIAALSSLDRLDPETDPVSSYSVTILPLLVLNHTLTSLPPSLQDMQLLVPLLGDQNHQEYAPKLRQLWLCEDALADA